MVATSVGGTATGKGGNRVVMDDLQNPEQAESEVERETADRFFNRTLSTRLDNKIEGAFIAVMQRLHQADIAAKCIELGYTLVKIPAICPAKTIVTFPKSGVSFERPAGDILWPAREGPKEIREARIQLTPYGFASQYQQDPIPAGGQIFEVEKIKIVQAAPKHARRVRFWDKAGTEGGGAYSAGALLAKSQDGRIFVEDMVRGQWGPGTREQTIKQTTMLDSGRFGRNYRVYIEQEPGSSGKESNQLTIRRLHGVVAKSVVPERNVEGKVGRARPFATQVGVDNVYLVAAPWNKEFLEELRYFPNSTYKDQVDAASGAYMKLAKGRSSQSYDAI
jgi:predicted phage terminase large subunit-like protein